MWILFGWYKQHKTPLPIGQMATCASTFLELIPTNVCGPMPTKSIKWLSYFVIYVNDYSRFTTIYFLKHKFEVFTTFQNKKAYDNKQIDHKIKAL